MGGQTVPNPNTRVLAHAFSSRIKSRCLLNLSLVLGNKYAFLCPGNLHGYR